MGSSLDLENRHRAPSGTFLRTHSLDVTGMKTVEEKSQNNFLKSNDRSGPTTEKSVKKDKTNVLGMAPRFSALLVLLVGVVVVAAQRASGSTALQNILKNTHQSSQYGYPTDFTREIIPVCYDFYNSDRRTAQMD